MKDFAHRVAAITGAASGIGRALALELASHGAHLAICDVDEAGLAQTARDAIARGAKVSQARVDVAERAAVHAWADAVAAELGGVNLVFNNAGVALNGTIEEMSYEDLEWLLGINFWGVVHGTKAFLPHLIASGEGHIVNVSSVFGIIAVPTQSAYHAAKFAVRGYTECLREELELAGHPVSATCVHPGGIQTNIVRNARLTTSAGGPSRDDAIAQFDRAARTSPEKAARRILLGVQRNERRVLIGADARVIDWIQRLFPTAYQRLMIAATRRRGPFV